MPPASSTPPELSQLPPILTAARVSELLGVSVYTVRRWCQEGRVRYSRTVPGSGGGRLLIDRDSLLRAVGLLDGEARR